jgi:hypothetical protein
MNSEKNATVMPCCGSQAPLVTSRAFRKSPWNSRIMTAASSWPGWKPLMRHRSRIQRM